MITDQGNIFFRFRHSYKVWWKAKKTFSYLSSKKMMVQTAFKKFIAINNIDHSAKQVELNCSDKALMGEFHFRESSTMVSKISKGLWNQ